MLDDYKKEQPIVYKILTNAILSGKISHAYLFETRGYSKTLDVAYAFSKSLLCPLKQFNLSNCKDCPICSQIDNKNSLNVKLIQSDTNQIKIEQIDELKRDFSEKDVNNNKKIYIINDANKLNNKTQNSLLKFLEEPEDNIIAILVLENRYQLYETILSRCQIVTFNDKVEIKGDTVSKVANYLNNDKESTLKYIENENGKIDNIVHFIDYFESNGQAMTHANVSNLLFKYDYDTKEISQKNTNECIISKMKVILKLIDYTNYNVNNKMIIDKLIISLGGIK